MAALKCRHMTAFVFALLLVTGTLAEECLGNQCQGQDETSLFQTKLDVSQRNQRAEKHTVSEQPPGPMDPARIIGSTTTITDKQAVAVSDMLDDCNEVHWDGDSVSEGSFAAALGVGDKPFIKKDMANQYAEGDLASPGRRAVAHCSVPNKDYCPKNGNPFQIMTDMQFILASADVTTRMEGMGWMDVLDTPIPARKYKGNSAQYLKLAAADLEAAPPKEVFWLYDDTRAPETYPQWVSLAEWYAYCDKYLYKIVNHAGEVIEPDTSKPPFSVTAKSMGWGDKVSTCQPMM